MNYFGIDAAAVGAVLVGLLAYDVAKNGFSKAASGLVSGVKKVFNYLGALRAAAKVVNVKAPAPVAKPVAPAPPA